MVLWLTAALSFRTRLVERSGASMALGHRHPLGKKTFLVRMFCRMAGSVNIDFDDGTGACIFDLKAEFRDGSSLVQSGVDVCRVSQVTFR